MSWVASRAACEERRGVSHIEGPTVSDRTNPQSWPSFFEGTYRVRETRGRYPEERYEIKCSGGVYFSHRLGALGRAPKLVQVSSE